MKQTILAAALIFGMILGYLLGLWHQIAQKQNKIEFVKGE